jgi:hypothetical protein
MREEPETGLPENCIKGIPNSSFIHGGFIGAELFHFNERDNRDDGWSEQSINWQDDDHAIQFTLNQTKADGTLHFKAGVALLPRIEIDRIRDKFARIGLISYERKSLPGNPYHGNILLNSEMVKLPVMKAIAGTLALNSQYLARSDVDP